MGTGTTAWVPERGPGEGSRQRVRPQLAGEVAEVETGALPVAWVEAGGRTVVEEEAAIAEFPVGDADVA